MDIGKLLQISLCFNLFSRLTGSKFKVSGVTCNNFIRIGIFSEQKVNKSPPVDRTFGRSSHHVGVHMAVLRKILHHTPDREVGFFAVILAGRN